MLCGEFAGERFERREDCVDVGFGALEGGFCGCEVVLEFVVLRGLDYLWGVFGYCTEELLFGYLFEVAEAEFGE